MVDGSTDFDPLALRARLAERHAGCAELLEHPLYVDEQAASMPGWREWHAYRDLPPGLQDPPGLTAEDFATAYRNVPRPAGILDRKLGE